MNWWEWIRYRDIRELGEKGSLGVRLIIHLLDFGLFKAELNVASLKGWNILVGRTGSYQIEGGYAVRIG